MKKIGIIIFLIGFPFMFSHAVEPDILVTQDGESLKVYNLELSSNSVFYTLTESTDAMWGHFHNVEENVPLLNSCIFLKE